MEHLVLFVNYDGKELYKTMVEDGGTAIYKGELPKKDGEKFIGWSKPLNNIKDDMVVTARFEKVKSGKLRLGAVSFIQDEKDMKVIDYGTMTNEKILTKENDVER